MVIPLFQTDFLFLRHGRTVLNAADLIAGATDVPLDAVGRDQAEEAARALSSETVASIWVSPLLRARQTALAVAIRRGLQMRVRPQLAERHWGAWEGLPRASLIREETPPEGESPEDFHCRVLDGLTQIAGPFPVLIVAHSGVARILSSTLCPDQNGRRLENGEAVRWRRRSNGSWTAESLSFPERPMLSSN